MGRSSSSRGAPAVPQSPGQRPPLRPAGTTSAEAPKIGVLVVAYNAASTLAGVLDRIPPTFRHRISDIVISDDASSDATYLVGLGYRQLVPELPITVLRNPRNLGYGGNQKAGYQYAIDQGLDIVVMLHGDGQYAPECLPDLVAPLESGEADAVFGSRMLVPGSARRGGMPMYKYVGNKILTGVENRLLGTNLSEFHSGYRAYSVAALRELDFQANSDGFDFDTEIIIQLHDKGKRIGEVPIPTYYGDEICYVNGLKYAKDVVADVLRYRLRHTTPDSVHHTVEQGDEYGVKLAHDSSHRRILEWFAGRPALRVLDVGCSSGLLSERIRALGHTVVGVDALELPGVHSRVDAFVKADVAEGLPGKLPADFDVVLLADVLEHVRHPNRLLMSAQRHLRPRGVVLASVPNFAHWYPRARVMAGRFDYDRRGILDEDHVRFFTRRSFLRLVADAGMQVRRVDPVGVPFDRIASRPSRWTRWAQSADALAAGLWPNLFAYQYIVQLTCASAHGSVRDSHVA